VIVSTFLPFVQETSVVPRLLLKKLIRRFIVIISVITSVRTLHKKDFLSWLRTILFFRSLGPHCAYFRMRKLKSQVAKAYTVASVMRDK